MSQIYYCAKDKETDELDPHHYLERWDLPTETLGYKFVPVTITEVEEEKK